MPTELPNALIGAYAAFRRPRRPDDELTARELDDPSFTNPGFGLAPGLSRRVRSVDGAAAALVPGDGLVAVLERGGSSVGRCSDLLDGHGVLSSFRGTGLLLISGVVPDGVGQVAIVRRNGEAVAVAVPDHYYAVEVLARTTDELPAEVRFVLGGRERRQATPGVDDVLRWRSPA